MCPLREAPNCFYLAGILSRGRENVLGFDVVNIYTDMTHRDYWEWADKTAKWDDKTGPPANAQPDRKSADEDKKGSDKNTPKKTVGELVGFFESLRQLPPHPLTTKRRSIFN